MRFYDRTGLSLTNGDYVQFWYISGNRELTGKVVDIFFNESEPYCKWVDVEIVGAIYDQSIGIGFSSLIKLSPEQAMLLALES